MTMALLMLALMLTLKEKKRANKGLYNEETEDQSNFRDFL
jgi:hypothetical protein